MSSKSFRLIRIVLIGITLLLLRCLPAWARGAKEDWPRWRGPNGDGISQETDWDAEALNHGLKILWQVDIGFGYANVAIKDGCLYTAGRKKEDWFVTCLDAETGQTIWKYDTGRGLHPPQSAPTLDQGHLYVVGYEGEVLCLRAKDGDLVWSRNLVEDFGAIDSPYGHAACPAVDADLLVLNARFTGVALNKKNGDPVWMGDSYDELREEMGTRYEGEWATPVFYDYGDRRYALLFTYPGLYSVDLKTGEPLWFYEKIEPGTPHISDPLLFDGKVFVSSNETFCHGAVLDISGDQPRIVWESEEFGTYMSTAVYLDGFFYGVHGHYGIIKWCTLRCMDAKTGEVMWEENTGGASLCAADGKLIVLGADGILRIVEANPEAYIEISSCELPVKRIHKWWTMPVLCGGKIYCRNYYGDLVCIDVSE